MRYVAEDFVHESLEILASIFEAKGAAWKEVEAKRRYDGRFLHMIRVYRDLMIPFQQINLAENCFTP